MFRNGGVDFYNGNQTDLKKLISGEVLNAATGILNAGSSASITYSDVAPQFTISPVGGSFFTYFVKNQKFEVGTLSYSFGGANLTLEEGTYYFYLDESKAVKAVKVTGPDSVDSAIRNYALCGLGYWDSTDGTWMIRGYELHSTEMLPSTHLHLHDVLGAKWHWGIGLSDFSIEGSIPTGDTGSRFSYNAGEIHDEDISFDIEASASPASIPVWYRVGTTNWRFQASSDIPVIYDGSTRLAFNVLTGSTWSQQTVGQGNYVLCHVFATTDMVNPIVAIQGQSEYATLTAARAGADTELKELFLNGLPTPELVPIGTVIYQTNSTWTNASKRCKIVYVDAENNSYVDWREQDKLGGGSSGGGTSDHSLLSNLAYASSGHTGFQAALASLPREMLTAARTYYVRTDGNDSNTGLVDSAAGAFLTIQAAVAAYQALDCNGYDVTIRVGNGTYTAGASVTYRIGQGNLNLIGNSATPTSVVISTTGANCITGAGHPPGCQINVDGFQLQTTTSGHCISGQRGTYINYKNIVFGSCAGYHIDVAYAAFVRASGNYTITGSAIIHIAVSYGGYHYSPTQAITVTITGTPSFSLAFCCSFDVGVARPYNVTWSGSATGSRYLAVRNGVINTEGGGANYFPGNVAGSVATGGQYV